MKLQNEPDAPVEQEIDSPIQSSYETFIRNLNDVANANYYVTEEDVNND